MASQNRGLTDAEREFLRLLGVSGLRYMIVGMAGALLQGARGATEDVDLWIESTSDPRLAEAARQAGGSFVSGFGLMPAQLGGSGLEDIDIVVHMSGLGSFADEYSHAREIEVDGLPVQVLPLDRIVASKRAANRPKDHAVLHLLEQALIVAAEPDDNDP